MLIPTRVKWKIGKDSSYPIGAEKLSEAIADVPQAKEMQIVFAPPSRFRLLADEPYEVLSFEYDNYKGVPVLANGRPGSLWLIRVSAVPKTMVADIRAVLGAEIAIMVRPWLIACADQDVETASFGFVYSPVEHRLIGGPGHRRLKRARRN